MSLFEILVTKLKRLWQHCTTQKGPMDVNKQRIHGTSLLGVLGKSQSAGLDWISAIRSFESKKIQLANAVGFIFELSSILNLRLKSKKLNKRNNSRYDVRRRKVLP